MPDIMLDGHGEKRVGDVVTRNGEVIGTWAADELGFHSFTPAGQEEPVIGNYLIEVFSADVADWHETRGVL